MIDLSAVLLVLAFLGGYTLGAKIERSSWKKFQRNSERRWIAYCERLIAEDMQRTREAQFDSQRDGSKS